MSESITTNADLAVVRHYLTALGNGEVLDALSTFSMDAKMRDERGRERRGIREIAAAFASRDLPVTVDVEELAQEGEAVAVRMRMTFPEMAESREYRSVFRVNRDRIRSVVTDPLPTRHTRNRASRPG